MSWYYCDQCGDKVWATKSAKAVCTQCGSVLSDPPKQEMPTVDVFAAAHKLHFLPTDNVLTYDMPEDVAAVLRRDGSGRTVHVVGHAGSGERIAELRVLHGRSHAYMAVLASGVGALFVDQVGRTIAPSQIRNGQAPRRLEIPQSSQVATRFER